MHETFLSLETALEAKNKEKEGMFDLFSACIVMNPEQAQLVGFQFKIGSLGRAFEFCF